VLVQGDADTSPVNIRCHNTGVYPEEV